MRTTFDFQTHLAALAAVKGQRIPWTMSQHTDGYPQYPVEILAFAQAFYQSNEYDRHADAVLHRQGFYEGVPEDTVATIAHTSNDVVLVRAVLSVIVHGERGLPGMWAALSENGLLYDLVTRLALLQQQEKHA